MGFKDIEYERNGIKKFAQERFKNDLIAEGWSVVSEKKIKTEKAAPKSAPKAANKKD